MQDKQNDARNRLLYLATALFALGGLTAPASERERLDWTKHLPRPAYGSPVSPAAAPR